MLATYLPLSTDISLSDEKPPYMTAIFFFIFFFLGNLLINSLLTCIDLMH